MGEIKEELQKIGARPEDAIERFLGDEEMYLGYVWNFPDEPTMKRVTDAMDAENYEEAKLAIHAFKGIVKNLAFVKLADAASDMLEELREGNIDDAKEEYEAVKKQYKKHCDIIMSCK